MSDTEQQTYFTEEETSECSSLAHPSLFIDSMRQSGYNETETALAEIIDNSLDAGASKIHLICIENERKKVEKIAILDDGSGMDATALAECLKFGGSSGKRVRSAKKMGRFGVGLPSASISRCGRVDVWSWVAEGGVENALSTFLDVDKIRSGEMDGPRVPFRRPLPDSIYHLMSDSEKQQGGTLVLWSDLDYTKVLKTSVNILKKFADVIGRIHRKAIINNSLRIVGLSLDVDGNQCTDINGDHVWLEVPANDPLYITHIPDKDFPEGNRAMFSYEDMETQCKERVMTIVLDDEDTNNGQIPKENKVTIRSSYAKATTYDDIERGVRGSTIYGKHAAKNTGVSVLRNGREIFMDQRLLGNNIKTTDRWWGIEVDFPAGLDEVLGVTNNKQSMTNLVYYNYDIIMADFPSYLRSGEYDSSMNRIEVEKAFLRENYSQAAHYLKDVTEYIKDEIKILTSKTQDQAAKATRRHSTGLAGKDGTIQFPGKSVYVSRDVEVATTYEKDRKSESITLSEDDSAGLKASLSKSTMKEEDIPTVMHAIKDGDIRVFFTVRELEDKLTLFSWDKVGDVHNIFINSSHGIFNEGLYVIDEVRKKESTCANYVVNMGIIEQNIDNMPKEHLVKIIRVLNDGKLELLANVDKLASSVNLIFNAWRIYETAHPDIKRTAKDMRTEWGLSLKDICEKSMFGEEEEIEHNVL